MTVSELAALVGGRLASGVDPSVGISGAASLHDAGPRDVTFFGHPRYLPLLRTSMAAAALVPVDFTGTIPPICIYCEQPSHAFSRIVDHFTPPPLAYAPGVHPTAIVGEGVVLGKDVSIQPYVVIEDGAHIGDRTVIGAFGFIGRETRLGSDCLLHPRVSILSRCIVGDRVILHPGAVLGADGFGFRFAEGKHVKIPQVGIVQVDADVEVGANTTVDRARFGRTWIQEGTKLDNLVQVAHNVVIGRHSLLCGQVGLAGSVKVGDYVTLAGQVGVSGHLEIGNESIVCAQGGVMKSVPPKQVLLGTPAIPERTWKRQVVHLAKLESLRDRVSQLERQLNDVEKNFSKEI